MDLQAEWSLPWVFVANRRAVIFPTAAQEKSIRLTTKNPTKLAESAALLLTRGAFCQPTADSFRAELTLDLHIEDSDI